MGYESTLTTLNYCTPTMDRITHYTKMIMFLKLSAILIISFFLMNRFFKWLDK